MKDLKIYFFCSTHWDREWYIPFQEFRLKLVDTINDLMDILENNSEYKLFCLDGQTIVLEDYAEIETENAKKLKKYIEDGRIIVGPWYVMPDEFLLSGESLIRNLMVGDRIAKEWGGKPLKYGYVNDIFGHIAQMPQIFAGFGIKGSYVGRGLGNTDFNNFIWKSPDGTECYTTVGSYGAFKRRVMSKYGKEDFGELLKEWVDTAISRSKAPVVLISNTDDHKKASANTPLMLNKIKEMYPNAQLCDEDLSKMADELEKYKDLLPTVTGELNKPIDTVGNVGNNLKLLFNTLSSHYPVKYENDYCQNLLEKKIEPMLAISKINNNVINHKYVDVAYKYLLQNHPHDSICGCSADQVHKDMMYRFDQVKEIGESLYNRFLEFSPDVFWKDGSESEYELTVYNMLPAHREKYCFTDVYFHKGFKSTVGGRAAKENRNNFVLFDECGKEIPYQIIGIKRDVSKRILTANQSSANYDVYSIGFKTKIPAFGVKSFKIMPSKERVLYQDTMQHGNNWAENSLIRLTILSNGELEIFDKTSKKVYSGLNEFVDNGEVGDGWHHESPVNDVEISGFSSKVTVSNISSGLACVKFKIDKEIELPKRLEKDTLCRSGETAVLKISSIVTVEAESSAVKVDTVIQNNIKDHKLKMVFPTNTDGDKYFAGQAFTCISRSVGIDEKTVRWIEPDSVGKNMNGIIGKRDRKGNGLAFVSAQGIHEAGCLDDDNSTIEVTLYRCFDRVFLQTKSTRSQLQQELRFKYAFVPLAKKDTYADLLYIQHDIAGMDITYSRRVLDGYEVKKEKSYLEVNNRDIVLSIFKCAEDGNGYILRLYNSSAENADTNLKINFDFDAVEENNMNEEFIEFLTADNGNVALSFRPFEIKTVRIM